MKKRINNVLISLPVCFFFTFTVLLYGPLSIYLPNSEEIWFRMIEIWKIILPVSAIAMIMFAAFFYFLPDKLQKWFLALLFGGSLAFYVQGNLINKSYGTGVMDGTMVDWSQYRTYGIWNTLLWAACILLPVILTLILRKSDKMKKILIAASLFLTAIQIPAMVVQLINYQPNTNAKLSIKKENLFDLSEKENVIMIMLDTVDEKYYNQFLKDEPEFTEELTGFVHYKNVLTSGARTMIAVPAMFSGHPYTRDIPYSEYLQQVWGGENAFSVMAEQGYDVRVYSETFVFSEDAAEYISNYKMDGGKVGSYKVLLKKIYKMDLYKFFPHFLKRFAWFDTSEFNSARKMTGEYNMNDPRFIERFRESGFNTEDTADKVFVMYHLRGAHPIYNLDRNGERVESSTLKDQVAGCFTLVKEMLQNLRDLGLYDNSTIIILADHGDVGLAERPILLIKEAGSTGEYVTSKTPVSLFDMAIYLTKLAGATLEDQPYGEDFTELTEKSKRERHFFINTTGNSQAVIDEYKTTHGAGNEKYYKLVSSYQDMSGADTPYELGTTLSFKKDGTGNKYCIDGFGMNTGYRTKLLGPVSILQIPIADLPSEGELIVRVSLYYKGNEEKPFIVKANGHEILQEVSSKQTIKKGLQFRVPISYFTEDNVLTLEFDFPMVDQEELEWSVEDRTYTISITKVIIK